MYKEIPYNNEAFCQTCHPCIISTDNILLPDYLDELIHAMAEYNHDVWALARIKQGWTYGPERNDEIKTDPCLVPYELLPEEEKMYDLAASIETIKFIFNLGYTINRKKK